MSRPDQEMSTRNMSLVFSWPAGSPSISSVPVPLFSTRAMRKPSPRALHARRVLGKARAETIIEGQHLAALGLLPPARDHRGQALGLFLGQIVRLGEILVEVIEFPLVGIERRARGVVGDCLPAVEP